MILFNELADTCLGTAGRLVSVEIRPTPLELTSDFILHHLPLQRRLVPTTTMSCGYGIAMTAIDVDM